MAILDWPLKPTIVHLRPSLQKAIETDTDAGVAQRTDTPSSDSADNASPDADDANEETRDLVSSLVVALQGHRVAKKLRSKDTEGTVAGQLATLFNRLDSGQIQTSAFFPLIHAIVQEESDVEIWKAVLQLIASAARTTPPPSSKPSFGGTPRTYSSASHEGSEQTRALLADALRDEFYKRTYRDVTGFFEKYFDGKSWSQRGKDIYDAVKHEHANGRWTTFPKHPTERSVWDWVSQFQQKHLADARCIYYTTKKSSEMTGIDTEGQLDLLVKPLAGHASDLHDWADVRAIGEHTESIKEDKFLQLARYARDVFKAQPRRRFMHGFTLRRTSMELYVFDRSGAYSAKSFDIHDEPQRFIQAFAGYCMMSDEELGMDTFTEREGGRQYVTVKDEATGKNIRLGLEQVPIARQSAVVCRGTCCYRTIDGKHVAKFSWVSADKRLTEPELLAAAHEKNVKGVAQLVGQKRVASVAELREDLTFTKRKRLVSRQYRAGASSSGSTLATTPISDNPGTRRKRKSFGANESFSAKRSRSNSQASRLSQVHGANDSFNESRGSQLSEGEAPFTNRVLSCLVVKPAGRPLDSFTSVPELLMAFRDAIKAHRSLFLDGNILHRDISQNNIIITDPAENHGFSGMLIDLDLATQVDDEGKNVRTNNPGMTGTLKFMAIEVVELALQGSQRDLAHTYRHDLESFFYVFLSLCASERKATGGKRAKDVFQNWYTGSYDSIVGAKRGCMEPGGFEGLVLAKFRSEFGHLKGLARELRNTLFLEGALRTGLPDGDSSLLYDKMIGAFDRSLV